MRGSLVSVVGMGDDAELETVASKAVVGDGLAGVIQGRFVVPSRQDVEIVRVVHGVDPRCHRVPPVLHVATGEHARREVPVVRFAIDDDFSRRRQDSNAEILGFGGGQGRDPQENGDKRKQQRSIHFAFHGGTFEERERWDRSTSSVGELFGTRFAGVS